MQLLIPQTSVCVGNLRSLFGDPKFEKVVAGDYMQKAGFDAWRRFLS